jgi:hypothetical protein
VLFYLGTHRPHWLGMLDVPLFVSHRRLRSYKTMPRARSPWALDSGGFTELSMHGAWRTSEVQYAEAVQRYAEEVGLLQWAAPMDWMCEPQMLARTGLSVAGHQRLTVENYLRLREKGPFIPVLQGWEIGDYLDCVALYADYGVDLAEVPLVGVGSVCRRQDRAEIGVIFGELADAGIACHGFGVKKRGLTAYGHLLASADSMAWSYNARRNPPLPGCTHKNCANCVHWALRWREGVAQTHDGLAMHGRREGAS